jgi:hypothetical protein
VLDAFYYFDRGYLGSFVPYSLKFLDSLQIDDVVVRLSDTQMYDRRHIEAHIGVDIEDHPLISVLANSRHFLAFSKDHLISEQEADRELTHYTCSKIHRNTDFLIRL